LAKVWPFPDSASVGVPKLAINPQGEAARILQLLFDTLQRPAGQPDSPRAAALQGRLNDAVGTLTAQREALDLQIEAARRRGGLDAELTTLAAAVDRLEAEAARAARNNDVAAAQSAQAKLAPAKEEFVKLAQALALREVGPSLASETLYESALAIHEKAARSGADRRDEWRNAADWWTRYLEAYPQARRHSPDPERVAHAKALLKEAQGNAGQ
jgi:hypothetical protein